MSICAPPCTCAADNPLFPIANDAMPCARHGRSGDEFAMLRDEVERWRSRAQLDRAELERQIAGALKSAIDAHGPLQRGSISSAAKRIANQIEARRTEKTAQQA